MKKNIIRKITSILSSFFFLPSPSRAMELKNEQITETSWFESEYADDDFNENDNAIPIENREGLASCLVNKILKIWGG